MMVMQLYGVVEKSFNVLIDQLIAGSMSHPVAKNKLTLLNMIFIIACVINVYWYV